MYVQRNIAKRSRNHSCGENPNNALDIFSTLSHKRNDFREKKILNVKCVL
jgi:hypothetical protein